MRLMKVEFWVNDEAKVISFVPNQGWRHEAYEAVKDVLEKLNPFILQGFRFQ